MEGWDFGESDPGSVVGSDLFVHFVIICSPAAAVGLVSAAGQPAALPPMAMVIKYVTFRPSAGVKPQPEHQYRSTSTTTTTPLEATSKKKL